MVIKMTKRDKVTVEDIIGIVHTDEPTDSVEEVCKLRGRENRTEKRFTTVELPKPNRWGIWYDGAYLSTYQVCILLNEYVDVKKENEQLKKDLEENKELIQFKEQVFNLINKKLEENEKELNGVDTAMYYANKGTLNELKKELKQ